MYTNLKVPVLRSITLSQKPEPEKQELVLPTLRPVPEKTTVADGREKVEPEKPELMLPVLKPVPEKPIVPDVQQVGTAINQAPVQWQVRPLDSRPNLQALLEREQTNEHSNRQTTPPPSTASTPMDTPHLSKCVSAQVNQKFTVICTYRIPDKDSTISPVLKIIKIPSYILINLFTQS